MEVMTKVPDGTDLLLDTDRQFEGKPGDSTLRISGTKNGSHVYDGVFVETTPEEAQLVAWFLRELRAQSPELQAKISQEIQATYPATVSGRDAHQIGEICWSAIRQWIAEKYMPTEHSAPESYFGHLAERFERAASRARQPVLGHAGGGGNGGRAGGR